MFVLFEFSNKLHKLICRCRLILENNSNIQVKVRPIGALRYIYFWTSAATAVESCISGCQFSNRGHFLKCVWRVRDWCSVLCNILCFVCLLHDEIINWTANYGSVDRCRLGALRCSVSVKMKWITQVSFCYSVFSATRGSLPTWIFVCCLYSSSKRWLPEIFLQIR